MLWCHLILQIFDVVFGGVTGYYVSNNVDPDLSASVLPSPEYVGRAVLSNGPGGPGPPSLRGPQTAHALFFHLMK